MKRDVKAQKIVRILEELYPETPIPLVHSDLYTLLVAVMLSAQTTDKKVNEVTPRLFEMAQSPIQMALCSVENILVHIKPLGLAPTKAKNLKTLSQQLVEKHQGRVPESFEDLEALAGVGHKTASVVMSQGFGHPAFPVDTHIHRLAYRWGLSDGSNVERTERDLKHIFEEPLWNKLHLQIIFFGRAFCPARNHDLSLCPICGWAASKKRIQEEMKRAQSKRKPRSST